MYSGMAARMGQDLGIDPNIPQSAGDLAQGGDETRRLYLLGSLFMLDACLTMGSAYILPGSAELTRSWAIRHVLCPFGIDDHYLSGNHRYEWYGHEHVAPPIHLYSQGIHPGRVDGKGAACAIVGK
jgi:hypothetical protein